MDRRTKNKQPLPKMSISQRTLLGTMEQFGWDFWFARNANERNQVVVVRHESTGRVAVLEEDYWEENHNLEIRS